MNLQKARDLSRLPSERLMSSPDLIRAVWTLGAALDEIEQACGPATARTRQLAPAILSILSGEKL